MANLNIPFLLLQEKSQSPFIIDSVHSRIEDEFLLLSDKNSGCLALCLQDSVVTYSDDGRTTKFIANVRPKILCVPSIYPDHAPILHDFCFIKSPASKILSTSDQLLVTIHDNILRLWNTDDGRNIMRSPESLFENREPRRIWSMEQPGIILCFCESKDILVINVYTMTLAQTISADFECLKSCRFSSNTLSLIDSKARIYTWCNQTLELKPSQRPNKKLKQCSNLLLNQDTKPQFDYQLKSTLQGSFENNDNIGGRMNRGRGAHREILLYDENLIVFQDRIEVVGPNKKVLLQYEQEVLDDSYDVFSKKKVQQVAQKWFLSAFKDQEKIICVDNEYNLIKYDLQCNQLSIQNLFDDGHLFDLAAKHTDPEANRTLLQSQEELVKIKLKALKEKMTQQQTFKMNNGIIYTYHKTQVIFWAVDSDNMKIPVHVNDVDIYGQFSNPYKDQNCLINVNQFISKNYFSRHQHSFFYCDEKVLDQTFYISSDFPSMILGTNYGRIFIIQLFQDIEGRSFPVIVLDCHHSSPISCLYIAYSSSRRKHSKSMERSSSMTMAQSISTDSGGHLIATSDDGTISITNMNSGDIVSQLANFSILRNEREKKRIDEFMKQRESNQRLKRRQSFSHNFTTDRYFNLVKVQPQKVFESCSFGRISRIVEVQILQQSQLERQKHLQLLAQDPVKLQQIHGFDPAPQGGAGQGLFSEPTQPLIKKDVSHSADHMKESENSAPSQHLYNHHLQAIRDLSLSDSFGNQLSPLINELMPFKASYACLDTEHSAAYIFQIQANQYDMLKIQGLDSNPIGVYEDVLQNVIHVVTERDLNTYSYNKRSKQLIRKSNYAFTQSALQMNQTVLTLTEQQQYFKLAGKMQLHQNQKYDQYNFQQQFQDKGRKTSSQSSGHHKVLDYLSLSLQLPLYYHPHNMLSQKFTKTIKDMLPHREELKACIHQHRDVKNALRNLITQEFVWNDRYKSDFSQEYYQAQGAVTPILTSENFKQQMLIINTKDMINVFKSRMKVLSEFLGKVNRAGSQAGEDSSQTEQRQEAPNISADYLQNSKWPTRLMALVHPFTLDENLDENLELFFGLSVPYIDFRLGVQGVDEAFSFVIDRDDKDKEFKVGENILGTNSGQHYGETIRFLKQSIQIKQDKEAISVVTPTKLVFINSEFWKASPYMSTVISAFFLSTLVSIVEFQQSDITTLLQDWLNIVQYITSSNGNEAKPLSVSSLSQLMLRKDHSVSSCARDVIMKPLLSSGSSIQYIKDEINQWQDLIMDTYLKLKEDSSMRQAYDGVAGSTTSRIQTQVPQGLGELPRSGSFSARGPPSRRGDSSGNLTFGPADQISSSTLDQKFRMDEMPQRHATVVHQPVSKPENSNPDKSINHFFGELEIRGLVNLSYYALYSQDGPEELKIDTDVQNRLCKCTVILTREIMTKFTINSKEHQNLLTILMQLLQTQMRAQVPTFKTKVIKEDVIKILLLIYDFYKKQLRDERFLTRVVAENFHLIHPKNSELYLKLTAAKTLLEIGTYFTEDFLVLIDEQATTLKDGPEYQRNVLDVLRYFINGSREGLEPYLIQIVQTLLKCLDPNDEQLRKNSTQLISIILSTMVKSFTMIAFHHETQRLAVGTPSGPIAIYDVRTSAKWKILEGHQKNVVCVEFDTKGNLLASYSSADLTLRLWKVGNTGFFSTIMGGTGKSVKEWPLPPLKKSNNEGRRQNEKLQKLKQSEPKRPGQASSENFGKCKIKFIENEKTIELIREDGSRSEHRIQK